MMRIIGRYSHRLIYRNMFSCVFFNPSIHNQYQDSYYPLITSFYWIHYESTINIPVEHKKAGVLTGKRNFLTSSMAWAMRR